MNTDAHNYLLRILVGLIVGLVLALILCEYILMVEAGSVIPILQASLLCRLRFALIVAVFLIIAITIALNKNGAFCILFKYRWLFAVGILAICVLFELSGSSIGLLIDAAGGDGSTLIGNSRPIRTDEWMVYTPMSISQCTTDGGVFSYFQDSMRGTDTDMFAVYGQPTWDIAEIFRPFHWGYLLLGASKGLSFFWFGRLIILFMVSFEFAYRLICRKSKMFSVAYAILIALSSAVQWWFAVNSLVEIILFGQLALIFFNCYLHTSNFRIRILYAVGIGWCLGIFALAFYPAWQIPFGYIFLAILIGLCIEQRPLKTKLKSKDLLSLLIALFIVAFAVVYVFFFKSWETVQIVMDTVYPGSRNAEGGGGYFYYFFYYPLNLIAPLNTGGLVNNPTDVSTIFCFFPLCMVLPIIVMVQKRRPIPLIIALYIFTLLLFLYAAFGIPKWLSTILLLEKATAKRAVIAAEFGMVVLIFLSLSHGFKIKRWQGISLIAINALIVLLAILASQMYTEYIRLAIIMALSILFLLPFVIKFKKFKEQILCCCVAIGILGGLFVNPLRGGLDSYFNNDLSQAISENSSSQDLWATVEGSVYLHNLPASLGFRTLNSTNTYPQISTWKKLDPTGQYEEVYNRYAHIAITLKETGETEFILNYPDTFTVETTVDGLRELGVNRIISSQELDSEFHSLQLLYNDEASGMKIFELE